MTAIVGRLTGIARRAKHRAPMEECVDGSIISAAGLEGDFKGAKYRRRQITILEREAWEAAIAELDCTLAWTTRRANLLIEGIRLPRSKGAIVRIGPVQLEVTDQTYPCRRMDEACRGLLSALAKDWRGGVTTRVLQGGEISIGDPVEVLFSPPEQIPLRLPG